MDNYAIELLHITKVFPGIVANDDITLRVRYGEIHALLGENGAGKSTLMSVLFGLYQPEEGEILVMIGYVTYVGNTSMEVEIDSYVERGDGMRYLVNRAFSVMVAVDKNERPTRIPGLIIHTEAEKGRHEAALLRRDMRKERRDAGF